MCRSAEFELQEQRSAGHALTSLKLVNSKALQQLCAIGCDNPTDICWQGHHPLRFHDSNTLARSFSSAELGCNAAL